jgi:TetR/AcrR family transcriptional regulator, regulator of cefoperazone and chloramphenicol sensitivity
LNSDQPVKPPRRRYDAPRRRQQAAATRARILAAARQLLRERGYAATSLSMVARTAGVAPETLYAVFGSKRGLLSALVDAAVDPPVFDQQMQAALTPADATTLLRITAQFARAAYDRSWDIIEVMRGAGLADPEIAEAWRIADARARSAQAVLLAALVERGALQPHLTQAEAADVVWSLAGPDLYRLLVVESGWTSDRYQDWLADALVRLLLG